MRAIMRATSCCLLLLTGCGVCWSQDASNPVEATLCDLYQHPERYAGKMIKVRGGSVGELRIEDTLHDSHAETCPAYMRIIVVFPDQVRPAPGFQLVQDESYKSCQKRCTSQGQSTSMQPTKAASIRYLFGAIANGSEWVRTTRTATARNMNTMAE